MQASELVRTKRKAFGMSQKEFAELLGLKQNGERTIRGWENEEHLPTLQNWLQSMPLKPKYPSGRKRLRMH